MVLARLINALEAKDASSVWQVSSAATRALASDERGAVTLWLQHLQPAIARNFGIASVGYLIGDGDGVGIRLVEEPLPLTQVMSKPTSMMAWGAVPFVEEDGEWRADLPLFLRYDEWRMDVGLKG